MVGSCGSSGKEEKHFVGALPAVAVRDSVPLNDSFVDMSDTDNKFTVTDKRPG